MIQSYHNAIGARVYGTSCTVLPRAFGNLVCKLAHQWGFKPHRPTFGLVDRVKMPTACQLQFPKQLWGACNLTLVCRFHPEFQGCLSEVLPRKGIGEDVPAVIGRSMRQLLLSEPCLWRSSVDPVSMPDVFAVSICNRGPVGCVCSAWRNGHAWAWADGHVQSDSE
eukprot:359163-Chlamydomonas_euryale.AAC.7